MRLLGTITVGAGQTKNNLTTAVDFEIPGQCKAVYLLTTGADVKFASGPSATLSATADDFPLAANIAFGEALAQTATAPVVAIYSAAGASVTVYGTEG